MKPCFGTTNDLAIISTSGSGGLEAAIVNTLSPGDKVLAVSIGSFGDRFAKIARIFGADVTKLDVEWGHAADPAVLRAELAQAADPDTADRYEHALPAQQSWAGLRRYWSKRAVVP